MRSGEEQMFEGMKRELAELRRDPPGRRFRGYYDRHAARGEGAWRTALFVALGSVLLIGGVILSLPPGIPGFFLYLPGLILILSRLRFVARLFDRIDAAIHRWRGR